MENGKWGNDEAEGKGGGEGDIRNRNGGLGHCGGNRSSTFFSRFRGVAKRSLVLAMKPKPKPKPMPKPKPKQSQSKQSYVLASKPRENPLREFGWKRCKAGNGGGGAGC